MTKQNIKVVVSANIKRESVMIDAKDGEVIAKGTNKAQVAKKLYGRNK